MAHDPDDRKRQVVPRWRPYRVAARLNVLSEPRRETRDVPKPSPGEVEEIVAGWQLHKTPLYAAELVDIALLTGLSEAATDAARFLLSSVEGGSASSEMAKAVLALTDSATPSEEPLVLDVFQRHRRIAAARRDLHRFPRDPVRWVDMARDYSTLGQNTAAKRALRRALALAPDSRFVLRAASRFFLHMGDPEEAHRLIHRSDRTKADPWLLAAEVVAADKAGRSSRWLKLAERIVTSSMFEPRHISELAGALGTIEHEHGSRRRTRKFFEQALLDPTENTLAQAGWIERHSSMQMSDTPRHVPRAFEADAWEHLLGGRFQDSLEMSRKWLIDEPFATRAALFGSWLASTALDDILSATELAYAAKQANPSDPRPVAQLVFCYATQNRLSDAEAELNLLSVLLRHNEHADEDWDVLNAANRGLISFRRGDTEQGRQHYERAIQLATARKKKQLAAGALIYLVREECRANPAAADQLIARARPVLDAWPSFLRPAYEQLLQRASLEAHRRIG